MKIEIEVDSVKMLREVLCVAQHELDYLHVKYDIVKHLQPLIDELDKHRPLGPDGKHGDLHTPTCGCEDPFKPTKLWKVLDLDGLLWCETSVEKEARAAMCPGYTLYRLYEKTEYLWRKEDENE